MRRCQPIRRIPVILLGGLLPMARLRVTPVAVWFLRDSRKGSPTDMYLELSRLILCCSHHLSHKPGCQARHQSAGPKSHAYVCTRRCVNLVSHSPICLLTLCNLAHFCMPKSFANHEKLNFPNCAGKSMLEFPILSTGGLFPGGSKAGWNEPARVIITLSGSTATFCGLTYHDGKVKGGVAQCK